MSIATIANPLANPQELAGMLARMSPQQLQQYAQAHADNMAIVSMVMAEQSRRKKETTAMQGMAPAAPPVRDQVLAQGLPEDSGIGQLPAPNMQRMAGGGIVAFAGGGEGKAKADPAAYRAYALEQAQALGLDPGFVDAIFQQESKYNPTAKNPVSSATGIGQLIKKTGRSLGLRDEDFTDPYKNIDASLTLMSTLNKKYKGDPAKMAMAYHDGETLADKHLAANQGVVNPSQLKPEAQGYLAKVVGAVIPSAQAAAPAAGLAGTPQAQAGEAHTPDPSAGFNRRAERTWGQVPGEALQNVPSSAGNLFSSLGQMVMHPIDTAGNIADIAAGAAQHALPARLVNAINEAGTPEEQAAAKRTRDAASATAQFFRDRYGNAQGIKETLAVDPVGALADAATVFTGGAGLARRAGAVGSKIGEIRAANAAVKGAEGLQDAAAIKQAAADAAAAKAAGVLGPQQLLPTQANLIPPTPAPSGIVAATNAQANARKLAQVKAVEDAAKASGLEATEAGKAAAAARTAAEADIAAAKAPLTVKPLPKKLKGLAGAAAAAKLPEIFDGEAATKDNTPAAEDLSKWDKQTAVDVAKATVPAAEQKKTGFSNDDWMMLGLQLLANNTAGTTPFMALGKAGIGTLTAKKERENQDFINQYRAAETKKAEAEAKYYGSDTRQMSAATKEANEAFDNWKSGLSAIEKAQITKEQIEAKRVQLMQQAFAMYNLPMPAGLSAGAPSSGNSTFVLDPTGTKLIPRG